MTSVLCTPSPRRNSRQNRLSSDRLAAVTPTHKSSLPSSAFNFNSPIVSTARRVPPSAASLVNYAETRSTSSDDPNSSDDDQPDDLEGLGDSHGSSGSPATPAPRKHSSYAALTDLPSVPRRNQNRRISRGGLASPGRPIAAPRFVGTPQAVPKTPVVPDEWHASGPESMRGLSLNDVWKEQSLENRESPTGASARAMKRHPSAASYMPPRHRRVMSPRTDDPLPASPTFLDAQPLHIKTVLANERTSDLSPLSPFNTNTPFPSIHFGSQDPSVDSYPVFSPLRSNPYPLIAENNFTPSLLRDASPPSIWSMASLSSSTSTTSDVSTSQSHDGYFPRYEALSLSRSQGSRAHPRRLSFVRDLLNDESDSAGDGSYGSLSSVPEQPQLAPPLGPSNLSRWPPSSNESTPMGSETEEMTSENVFEMMTRAVQNASRGDGKPVMPDTPVKSNWKKDRKWQSTSKDWGKAKEQFGKMLKGAPRKSLPAHFSSVDTNRPESPDSDPSPSKGLAPSRPTLGTRRSTYSPGERLEEDSPTSLRRPVPALALTSPKEVDRVPRRPSSMSFFQRAQNLRRSSSGAFSISSDQGSDQLTPTRGTTGGWKAAPMVLHSSQESNVTAVSQESQTAFASSSPYANSWGPSHIPTAKRPSLPLPHATPAPSNNPRTHLPIRPRSSLHVPSPFVAPKPFAQRSSLPASETPLPRGMRHDSIPPKPFNTVNWATSVPKAFNLHVDFRDGPNSPSTLGPKSSRPFSTIGNIRRPQSSSPLATLGASSNGVTVVEEMPGRFDRDFEEEEVIGRGSFGEVLRVTAKASLANQAYAVKRSKPFSGPRQRARVIEEVEILHHLTDLTGPCLSTPSTQRSMPGHDNILHFVDAWEEESVLYIRTEMCSLGNLDIFLSEWWRTVGRLDEGRLWKIMSELVNGIHFMHRSGVIHLDLKPGNIFITHDGRLRIGDFGMATRWPRPTMVDGALTVLEREGDRRYLAPEVLEGRYGPNVDVFSFGMIMLKAASNLDVPDNQEDWHRLRRGDFSRVHFKNLSESMVNTIKWAMTPDYKRRPTIQNISSMPELVRTRAIMKQRRLDEALAKDSFMFRASAFSRVGPTFISDILELGDSMDTS